MTATDAQVRIPTAVVVGAACPFFPRPGGSTPREGVRRTCSNPPK